MNKKPKKDMVTIQLRMTVEEALHFDMLAEAQGRNRSNLAYYLIAQSGALGKKEKQNERS